MSVLSRSHSQTTLSVLSQLRLVGSAMSAMIRAIRNRRAARQVSDFPDYLLTDIGLKRDDVHEALSAHWRDDPTFQLALRAAERRRGR